MKITLISLLLLGILLPYSGNAQETKIIETNSQTIRIDPAVANGGSSSQLFTEINYIPLETTKESLFGSITKLEVAGDNFIIYDDDTECILIFDKAGKFQSKISAAKMAGKAENSKIERFDGFRLLRNKGEYVIQISFKGKAYNYDTKGALLKVNKIKDKAPAFFEQYDFNDSIKVVSFYQDKTSEDNSEYRYALLKNDRILSKYMKINNDKNSSMGNFAVGGPSFIGTDDPNVRNTTTYYEYKIYKITPEGMSVAYDIVFPSIYALPGDFNTNPIYSGKQMDYFFRNAGKVYGIGYTYQIGNYLYFKCGSLGSSIRKNGSFVYNLKDQNLISLNRLDIDSLSHFLPFISKRWEIDLQKYNNGYFYTSFSSLEMFTYYAAEKKRNHKYPAVMESYFRTGNKKDNPVIVQLKPKTN